MRNLLFFLAASNLLLLSGCGPTPPACDASTCAGCCTPQGTCAGGGSPLECGSGGANCSACAPGQSCLTGSCFTLPSCTPKTCASASANCGALSDGCGGILSCGTCTAGESCGAGGTPNVCGPGTCTPRTCASEGFDCGMASDGCAAVLDCGTCQAGSTCTANRCTCQPRTCSSLGKDCGPLSDGCGRTLDCGTCTSPQTCGGGGTANVCGTGSCTPTTCAAQGKDCGTLEDGCGGMLSCGTCTAPQTCGGAGVANVCGATCALSCPPGYSCDALGACRGGSPVNLSFDVRTFTVSGSVTLNGAPPSGTGSTGSCSTSPRGWVELSDAARGYSFSLPIACMGTPAPFTGLVYPGTYRVKVRGNTSYSNLPG
ncbi:MAG: hypothetical protein IT380_02285, partial [Myxococcales bacterium]|nr:hypothetical protein [Myxococcales bacterium]